MYYKVEVAKRKTKCISCGKDIMRGERRLRIAETDYNPYFRYECLDLGCGYATIQNEIKRLNGLANEILQDGIRI